MNGAVSLTTPLLGVMVLVAVAGLGAGPAGMKVLFGVVVPYAAIAIFILGVVGKIVAWGRVPVPFSIPTTGGQGISLPWFKTAYFDCPYNTWGVIGRMALEILLFRSLFRNTKAEVGHGARVTFTSAKWLWLAGIVFHYTFLIILVRHVRFFLEPVPSFVELISSIDGFFEILVPTVFITDILLVAAATYLFLRRVFIPQIRYISLPSDYFPLFLILGITITGVLMRNVWKVDLNSVKQLAMGLVTFSPVVPQGIGVILYVHLFLVSVLLAYFPFSKLMHGPGVFLSPTRNLANDSRMVRHVNPWNYPVKVHTYEEYEDEFRAKMIETGIPVEKEE
jgi:nitrate reductase gamma subunit